MVSELKKRSKGKKEGDNEVNQPEVKEVKSTANGPSDSNAETPVVPLRYGNMPTFSGQRLWSRSALIIGLMAVVYFNSNTNVKQSAFGKYDETIRGRAFDTKCADDYDSAMKHFGGCRPAKCGRIVADVLEGSSEFFLSDLAKRIFVYGKGNSGIYDLFTGKLLHDIESDLIVAEGTEKNKIFKLTDREYLQSSSSAVHQMISQHFKIDGFQLRLNSAFYTRLTSTGKRKNHLTKLTVHQTSFSAHFSAIIYLTDFGKEFNGGRLVFPDSDSTNRTVEGRKGRVVAFTSGLDNQHTTEPVTKGGLITLVLGFTCNPKEKIGTIKLPSSK